MRQNPDYGGNPSENEERRISIVPGWTQKKQGLLNNPGEHDMEMLMLSELIIALSKDVFCE